MRSERVAMTDVVEDGRVAHAAAAGQLGARIGGAVVDVELLGQAMAEDGRVEHLLEALLAGDKRQGQRRLVDSGEADRVRARRYGGVHGPPLLGDPDLPGFQLVVRCDADAAVLLLVV